MANLISLQAANVWVTLQRTPRATAKEIADGSGVSRRTVGLHLQKWTRIGLVRAYPTSPPRYKVDLKRAEPLAAQKFAVLMDACVAYGLADEPVQESRREQITVHLPPGGTTKGKTKPKRKRARSGKVSQRSGKAVHGSSKLGRGSGK